jgi:hypothetical protein
MAGVFVPTMPSHLNCLSKEESSLFSSLLNMSYDKGAEINIDLAMRNILLEKILDYFKLQLGSSITAKSLAVLREMLH